MRLSASSRVCPDVAASAYTGTTASEMPKKISPWSASVGLSAIVEVDSYTGVTSRSATDRHGDERDGRDHDRPLAAPQHADQLVEIHCPPSRVRPAVRVGQQ